jgi:hypothetical protein
MLNLSLDSLEERADESTGNSRSRNFLVEEAEPAGEVDTCVGHGRDRRASDTDAAAANGDSDWDILSHRMESAMQYSVEGEIVHIQRLGRWASPPRRKRGPQEC